MAASDVPFTIHYVSLYGKTPEDKTGYSSVEISEELAPILTTPGFVFEGWYTSPSFEESTKVIVGDTYFVDFSDKYFYAKWTALNDKFISNSNLQYLWQHILARIGEAVGVIQPISDEKIDEICGSSIVAASEVTF